MQRLSEEKIAIGLLTFFAIWLFVDLPIAFAQPPPTQTQEATEYWTVTGLHLKITDTLIAVFTALLFFATAALFLATKNLVRGAEITAERQLRAYVSAYAKTIDKGVSLWECKITIRNSGQTPAYELTQKSSCAIFDVSGANQDFEIVVPYLSKSSLSPGAFIETTVHIPVMRADVEAVEDGKKVFFVFGEIQYRDAFDRERFTKFRFHHNNTASGDTH